MFDRVDFRIAPDIVLIEYLAVVKEECIDLRHGEDVHELTNPVIDDYVPVFLGFVIGRVGRWHTYKPRFQSKEYQAASETVHCSWDTSTWDVSTWRRSRAMIRTVEIDVHL